MPNTTMAITITTAGAAAAAVNAIVIWSCQFWVVPEKDFLNNKPHQANLQ